jgi:hypothetical protein
VLTLVKGWETGMTATLSKRWAADPYVVADGLDESGMVCLEGAVSQEWLADAVAEVRRYLQVHGERFHLIDRMPGDNECPTIDSIPHDPDTLRFLTDIVRARLPEHAANPMTFRPRLRIVAGQVGGTDAFSFHYDAEAVTLVVPIILPDSPRGRAGELVGQFNKRPFRRSVLVNLFDKMIGLSAFYRWLLLRNDGARTRTAEWQVGNAYLFWGYRSLHGLSPVEQGAVRATLVMHFGLPHGSNRVLATAAGLRHAISPGPRQHAELAPAVGHS